MDVAHAAGLTGTQAPLLRAAHRRWTQWAAVHPVLAGVDGIDGLRVATPADARRCDDGGEDARDAVLLALAQLAAHDGGNDQAAAAALAWALLPGAVRLARTLGGLSPWVDQLVAGQLWIEVRTFPWRRLRRVAANVLRNVRSRVLADCQAGSQLRRSDPTWAYTRLVGPDTSCERANPASPGSTWDGAFGAVGLPAADAAAVEARALLGWAERARVLSPADVRLLELVLEQAVRMPPKGAGRGRAGLLGRALSEAVGRECALSGATVRRRTGKILNTLRDAARHGNITAEWADWAVAA